MLSAEANAIIIALRDGLSRLDEHKSQPERDLVYQAIASHMRSAAPMAFVGAPAELVPTSDALIDLGAGQLVRLRVLDGRLNMYVCEAASHDVNVVLDDSKREQLRAALGVVR